jgi:hypothetical protein
MKYATVLPGIFQTAITHFHKFLEENKKELGDRKGLYLAGIDLKEGGFLSSGMILGTLPPEKIIEKTGYAFEKLTRVIKGKYFTTFPTQDYSLGQYGGGIKIPDILALAGSGFPPNLDHKFLVEVLNLSGNLTEKYYQLIMGEFEIFRGHGTNIPA